MIRQSLEDYLKIADVDACGAEPSLARKAGGGGKWVKKHSIELWSLAGI